MTRVLLIELSLFLLPFVCFAGWRWFVKGARGRQEVMSDAPILALLLMAISLLGAGLFFLASKEVVGPEGRYHPPVYKDGRIEPGYFEKDQPLK